MAKTREIIQLLEENGWTLIRTKGSHRQFRNPQQPDRGTITVAGHPNIEMPKGTANAILKLAGLKK